VSFTAINLCVASQRMFIVVYFVIDSVRKLLDTPSDLFFMRSLHKLNQMGHNGMLLSVSMFHP
jgi:hypothetical protein